MECMKCGHDNEPDANFCRNCGAQITVPKGIKEQVEFIPVRRRVKDQDITAGMVIGFAFIFIGIIMAVAIFTTFFTDFGEGIGGFFGDFGEDMGQIGEDFGNFTGNWGENLGESLGSFFSGQAWWDILKILLVGFFIIAGAIIIIYNLSKQR